MAVCNGLGLDLHWRHRFGEGKIVSAGATGEPFSSLLRIAAAKAEPCARLVLHCGACRNPNALNSSFADDDRCAAGFLHFGRVCV